MDVKNILFWNDNISTIIKSILFDISNYIKTESKILIIIGIITFIIEYIITNKKLITKKDPTMKNIINNEETTTPTPKKSLFSFLKKDKERALKEGNAIRNGELSEAENDLRTINNILAKY